VPRYVIHCSHEQIPPSRLPRSIKHAEEAGFDGGMSSDHFAPWSVRQGQSGFAWSFLGAALASTALPFGVVYAPGQRYLRRMLDAFGDAGRKVLQVHLSWAENDEEALRIAHDQWRTNVFDPPICWDLDTVEAFDVASALVRPQDVASKVLISSDPRRHVAWLQEYAALGFDDIALHHVGQDLDAFIDAFGEHVLPELA
jgi:alkanesulfonate monooxygenase SsuD/methylene tetrahydromethanopterin reductase-like flavin-dependent oxidoreductase (luciferase family)